ncbi:Chloroplastic group IIB intron splicing facilitator CRS2 chloroplastic [Dissostichus eleginoides]|uniref:Chloroplastic group IIB intron splicing facilitator CRS2 chloroplastic n=1 Tax=Dissostichus eleginoides TaxID=100907 RepID=A0AAD9FB78_DISEL|nr:Chloroplastic group IIB intron splicing facilitator CRS2 chloroplastic [Dissostichus eleginoides]
MAWGLSGDVLSHRLIYSRELLLDIRSLAASNPIPPIPHFLRSSSTNALPGGMLPKNRRRKRGRRGGVQRILRTNGLDNRRRLPPLPTILLSNVQSIRNKLEACAKFKRDYRDACLLQGRVSATGTRVCYRDACLLLTETWLKASDSNEDLHITGFGYPDRMDRSPVITNKSRGGGVCFYINKREFPQLFFTIVYIHPRQAPQQPPS